MWVFPEVGWGGGFGGVSGRHGSESRDVGPVAPMRAGRPGAFAFLRAACACYRSRYAALGGFKLMFSPLGRILSVGGFGGGGADRADLRCRDADAGQAATQQMMYGSRLYMGPTVLQVSFVLVLSAAALTPGISAQQYGAVAAVVALWGLVRGVQSTVGIKTAEGRKSAALDRQMVLWGHPDFPVRRAGRGCLGRSGTARSGRCMELRRSTPPSCCWPFAMNGIW